MTQAWDFMNADLLWASCPDARAISVEEAFHNIKVLGPRIVNMCATYTTYTWEAGSKEKAAPIATLGDLIAYSEAELMREPNIHRKSVEAIKEVLAKHGLELAK